MPISLRSLLGLGALVGVALAVPASAQQTSERPEITVPLPNGPGVFYYRAGTPGGVRIRSRNRPASSDSVATPEASEPRMAAPAATPRAPASRDRDSISRLDLLLLERSLLDAIDDAVDRRAREIPRYEPVSPLAPPYRPEAPPIVVQPPTAPTAPTPPPAPSASGPVTAREIERSILETGLFRTTNINFEFARAELLPISTSTLNVLADVLTRYPDLRIEVGGHTDNVGSDAINDPLSQRRAESVMGYLIASGIAPSRLSAVGYGERRPVASNDSETGRALNRRVEFTVLNPEAAEQETRTETPIEGDALRDLIRQEIERQRDGG